MSYFVQGKEYDMIMYAKFQYYNMHGFLYLSSSNLAFLEFYIMSYGEKDDLVKSSDNICSRGFIQNLLFIFLRME
jgi:hypothetical protein